MALTRKKSKKQTVAFPLSIFETADTKEDLEDWLLSQNPEFIKKMRKARQEGIQGKGKDWQALKEELCIKDLFVHFRKDLGLISFYDTLAYKGLMKCNLKTSMNTS